MSDMANKPLSLSPARYYSDIYTLCLKNKIIPDIIDCNLKDYPILIMFGTNISDTTGHQMTDQIPTSPNVCFCTT